MAAVNIPVVAQVLCIATIESAPKDLPSSGHETLDFQKCAPHVIAGLSFGWDFLLDRLATFTVFLNA